MITHLQKQLNDRTIGIRGGFTANTTSTYQRSTSPFTSNASLNVNVNSREYANLSMGNTTSSRLKFTSTGGEREGNDGVDKGSRKEI